MNLDLLDSVYRIFEEVKSLTGKDIQLIEKKSLDTYASVKIARRSMPSHFMYYKPEHTGIISHLVAHECGHILRIYGVGPENRLIPFTDNQLKLKAIEEIEPETQKLSQVLSFEKRRQLVDIWYTGIIKQLTNYPSDIMIEKWIYDKYPELRTYQSRYMKRQYDEAVQALSGQIERVTPRKILKASNAMNYAFFYILGEHFKDNYYMRRYDRSAYADTGNQLILLRQESEDSYKSDLDTVNKWAESLKLSHWFAWRDFEDVPDNYLDTF